VSQPPRLARDKVVSAERLPALLARARTDGARVVLTNGCFDLLHVGHVRSLEQARALGDLLVVGVNADATVRALKGPGRPLLPAGERAELLAALAAVDWAAIFEEPTADALIRMVRPHVYAKGGDYAPGTLPEARTAAEVGADVRLVDLLPGRSTSALMRAIAERYGQFVARRPSDAP
jgi:rfaE bifunctional protein nucleotidyltransferase chain/domain